MAQGTCAPLLDSLDCISHPEYLQKAAKHGQGVWILLQYKGKEEAVDLVELWSVRACLLAELPKKSFVLLEGRRD